MEGFIIKGIAGRYLVGVNGDAYDCAARGILKKKNIRLLVGDKVIITLDDYDKSKGIIEDVLARSNALVRPPVANVSQVVVVFAIKQPDPNMNLLDKLLAICAFHQLNVVLCFNKVDLDDHHKIDEIKEIYINVGYNLIPTSAKEHIEIDALKEALKDEISVFAGPSGVGKSSLLNEIEEDINLEVGGLSKKISRGKHTTRHCELMMLPEGGMVADTPGFTAMDVTEIDLEVLDTCFLEFVPFIEKCKFNNCMHIKEPGCAVKEAVKNKKIHENRYESYMYFVKEIEDHRRNKSW
jgi:ribosome biogenesis GTPase